MGKYWFLPVCIIFIVLFLTLTTSVSASEPSIIVGANLSEYQKPSGSQCNINVPAQYSTIQAGVDGSKPGDTVCVGPGTYNENVIVGKSIRLSGSGAARSIINGQITNEVPGYYTVLIANADNSIIEGFFIKGVGGANNATVLLTDSSLTGVSLQYNWIVAGDKEIAVRADGAPTNGLIKNNVLEGNNSPQLGYVGAGDSINFLNNTFMGTVSVALFEASSNNLIKQNVFNISGSSSVRVSVHWTTVINENSLNGNVWNTYLPEGTLNAEGNWWGDTDPSNNIIGEVNYSNFATSPFPEYSMPLLDQPSIQTPAQATQDLIDFVATLNLQEGIENSLNHKLNAAIKSLDDINQQNDLMALNLFQAFINAVNAQRGNMITGEQADILTEKAQEIINQIIIVLPTSMILNYL